MHVVFVGAEPVGESPLALTKEITDLQLQVTPNSYEPVAFSFLPALNVVDLPKELAGRNPDILHIAAHGTDEALCLHDDQRHAVQLTARMLGAFVADCPRLRLIYLNACNSTDIAKSLVKSNAVMLAIGMTAPITNSTACSAAVAFYRRLLNGATLASAFELCKQMVEATGSATSVSADIFSRRRVELDVVFHPVPRLLARFVGQPRRNSDGRYDVKFGISGCAPGTRQVVFFTDDDGFIQDGESLENDLVYVVRSTPDRRHEIWTSEKLCWQTKSDHRLFATAVKADGGHYTLEGSLVGALELYYSTTAGLRNKNIDAGLAYLKG